MNRVSPEYGTFVITGGQFNAVSGGDLAAYAGYPNADFNVADYLALNQLAVILRIGPVRLDICLNALDFDPLSIRALLEHLIAHPIYLQVRMRSFLGGWLNESFLKIDQAVTRLGMILDRAASVPVSRLRIDAQDPDTPCAATGRVVDLWKHHKGMFSNAFVSDLAQTGLISRSFILEQGERGGWLVRFMGTGISTLGDWHTRVVGQPFSMPSTDAAYTCWTASHYASAVNSKKGRYDHIDAIVSTPDRLPSRIRYRRRVLPLATLNGKPLVVGYSVLSSDISLPL